MTNENTAVPTETVEDRIIAEVPVVSEEKFASLADRMKALVEEAVEVGAFAQYTLLCNNGVADAPIASTMYAGGPSLLAHSDGASPIVMLPSVASTVEHYLNEGKDVSALIVVDDNPIFTFDAKASTWALQPLLSECAEKGVVPYDTPSDFHAALNTIGAHGVKTALEDALKAAA